MIAFESALSFAWRHWKAILGLGTVAVLLFLLANARGDARHWEKTAAQTQAAFDQTVAQYRIAAEAAAKLDAQNVLRVKDEQAAVTERIENEYQGKLATAADRYERLRAQAAAYSSGAGSADVSASRDATCLAYAGTDCEGLPALLKAAQDNTDQLVALQTWVRGQAAIEVDGR